MSNTKIGISNFKAFGPKMQYFTKKPITLIYGPNSVGKSSLMRSLLYREYMKEPNFFDYGIESYRTKKVEYRNQYTSRFGDQLNIGTFETAVHMHDISQTINYDIEYKKSWDIDSFLPLYRVFFDSIWKILDQMNVDEMVDGIDSYFLKNEDDYTENEKLIDIHLISKCKIICLIEENDLKDPDKLAKFKWFIRYAWTQILIESIKIKSSVGAGSKIKYQIFVNDEILIECIKSSTLNSIQGPESVELYTNNKAFDLVFFKPKNLIVDEKCSFDIDYLVVSRYLSIDLFNLEENYTKYLKEQVTRILVKVIAPNEKFENIYIGPIRNIPDRNDLGGDNKFYKRQRRRQIKIDKAFWTCMAPNNIEKFFSKNKYFKDLYSNFLKFLFCSFIKKVRTFFNSILIRSKGFLFKYIKQNSNSNHYLWHSLIESKKVRNRVAEWLKDNGKHNSSYRLDVSNLKSGTVEYYDENKKTMREAPLSSISEIKFYDEHTKTHVHPQDMGVGIAQSLPIVIACNLYEAANIFIEQPELHLHPKLQMEIADEFIRSINEQYNDFMIETHSEHLLLRIMKRMRQTSEGTLEDESLRLTPDDVCILYVDNDDELTYLQELRLSPKGRLLDHWPNGFFEDGFRERFM